MDFSRLVEVSARKPAGGLSFGSGYLIAPGLVLTARHVTCADSGEPYDDVRVRFLAEDAEVRCRVAWPGRTDLDASLLRCVSFSGHEAPVRWGQLVASQTGIECEAAGFPRSMRQDNGLRDVEQMRGEINPGTGLLSRRIYVDVVSASPEPGNWGGMSGAPLWCGPLLVGVIAYDPAAFASRRLAAEPVARLIDDPGFRTALGTDVMVEAAELARRGPPQGTPGPAYLLRAETRTARFRSRASELAGLTAWALGSGVKVRLLTGPGGQGKTRLAQELGMRLGWAWTLLPDGTTLPAGVRQPLLVIMDYADGRPGQVSEVFLAAAAEPGHIPIRILLLARSAGEWWRNLRKQTAELEQGLAGVTVQELSALEDTPGGRENAFHEALNDYSEALTAMDCPHAEPENLPPPDFGDLRLGSALRLQMTALAMLLGTGHSNELPEDVILWHESRYWNRTVGHRGLILHEDTLRNAVAAAVLCGAASQAEAIDLLAHVPGLRDQGEDLRLRVARWLRDMYPPSADPPGGTILRTREHPFWGSLQPDLLAEHLVAGVDEELPDFLAGLLAATSSHQDHQALTILARASVSRARLASAVEALLLELPKLAVPAVAVATQTENPAPLVAALNGLVMQGDLPVELLDAICGALPERTQSLALFAVTVTRALVAKYLHMAEASPDVYPAGLETAWARLSYRLMMAGRHQEALAASERAVAILEQMAEAEPLILPYLATAVSNQGSQLANMGRPEEAIAVLQRAVELRESLAGAQADNRMLDLAVSLGNLAGAMAAAGRAQEALIHMRRAAALHGQLQEAGFDGDDRFTGLAFMLPNLSQILARAGSSQEALTTAQQAVTAHERLAEAAPDAWLPVLANSLAVASARLTDMGRYDEALAAAGRAVAIWERLAESLPDAHLPQLASSLSDLSRALAATGRPEEALAASRRAVAVSRWLADADPTHLPGLASSLNSLADDLYSASRQAEAVDSSRRAVALYRELATARPGSHLPGLAKSLITSSSVLDAAGETEEALAASEQAVAIYEELAETNPGGHTADWANALNNLAVLLGNIGRHQEALTAAQRAVSLSEPLAAEIPSVHLPHLAMHLGTLAARLSQADRTRDAVSACERAVELYDLAAAEHVTHLPGLARLLRNLSVFLWKADRREDALAAVQRAVGIYDRLLAGNPRETLPELAAALSFLSERLAEIGRGEGALQVAQRAVGIYDRHAASNPEQYLPRLAMLLNDAGTLLAEAQRHHESVVAAKQAVAIGERLAESDPDAHRQHLASFLFNLSLNLSRVERLAEAVDAGQRSVDIFDSLAEADPGTYRLDLATSLNSLSLRLLTMERYPDAVAASERAVEISQQLEASHPGAYLFDLGKALNNHSKALYAAGQQDEAFVAIRQAASAFSRLVETGEDSYLPMLTLALRNMSVLSAEEQEAECLAAIQEAVTACQRLARHDQEKFGLGLAESLAELGRQLLLELNNPAAALAPLEEAINLAAQNDRPDIRAQATTLFSLARWLSR